MIERIALPQKPSILLATSVVNIQENTKNPLVPIRVLNLSPDRITVGKGTRVLASVHTLDGNSVVVAGIDSNSPIQSEVSNAKQQQLWQAVECAAEKLIQNNKNSCMLYY